MSTMEMTNVSLECFKRLSGLEHMWLFSAQNPFKKTLGRGLGGEKATGSPSVPELNIAIPNLAADPKVLRKKLGCVLNLLSPCSSSKDVTFFSTRSISGLFCVLASSNVRLIRDILFSKKLQDVDAFLGLACVFSIFFCLFVTSIIPAVCSQSSPLRN